jgi:hypothetical protein
MEMCEAASEFTLSTRGPPPRNGWMIELRVLIAIDMLESMAEDAVIEGERAAEGWRGFLCA